MKVDTYKCDQCGQMKGELNHWFLFGSHDTQCRVVRWGFADREDELHLCSDACVIKQVQGWLSKQQVAAGKAAE